MKPIFKTVEVQPYQFDRLVKVMVADAHSVFSHGLEGLSIYVAGERDRVLLSMGHQPHSENSGVEIAHVRNRGVPIIEGSPAVDNRLGSLRDQGLVRLSMDGLIPLVERKSSTPSCQAFLPCACRP